MAGISWLTTVPKLTVLGLGLVAATLSGCKNDGAAGAGGNVPATIALSGTPLATVTVGQRYMFQPSTTAPQGTTVSYSIQNKPGWATLSTASGQLSGAPAAADVGVYTDIVISASDGMASASLPKFDINVNAPAVPTLTISGVPPATTLAGSSYRFVPQTSTSTSATLAFSIRNKPAWAGFDAATGALTGTPTASQVGSYASIGISVTDTVATATLPLFSIAVTQTGTGTATIAWLPPTQNTDGTALVDLAGYHLYYGTSASNLTQSISVNTVGVTSYVFTGLATGRWYFSVAAVNNGGTESERSAAVSKQI